MLFFLVEKKYFYNNNHFIKSKEIICFWISCELEVSSIFQFIETEQQVTLLAEKNDKYGFFYYLNIYWWQGDLWLILQPWKTALV